MILSQKVYKRDGEWGSETVKIQDHGTSVPCYDQNNEKFTGHVIHIQQVKNMNYAPDEEWVDYIIKDEVKGLISQQEIDARLQVMNIDLTHYEEIK